MHSTIICFLTEYYILLLFDFRKKFIIEVSLKDIYQRVYQIKRFFPLSLSNFDSITSKDIGLSFAVRDISNDCSERKKFMNN